MGVPKFEFKPHTEGAANDLKSKRSFVVMTPKLFIYSKAPAIYNGAIDRHKSA